MSISSKSRRPRMVSLAKQITLVRRVPTLSFPGGCLIAPTCALFAQQPFGPRVNGIVGQARNDEVAWAGGAAYEGIVQAAQGNFVWPGLLTAVFHDRFSFLN
jgi:hypothetical protein